MVSKGKVAKLHSCIDGPKKARRHALRFLPPLFEGTAEDLVPRFVFDR